MAATRVGKKPIAIINTRNTRLYGAVLKWTVFLWNVFLTCGSAAKV
jgi:hypothetical protein